MTIVHDGEAPELGRRLEHWPRPKPTPGRQRGANSTELRRTQGTRRVRTQTFVGGQVDQLSRARAPADAGQEYPSTKLRAVLVCRDETYFTRDQTACGALPSLAREHVAGADPG